MNSVAVVKTSSGSKYLQQLCKHLSRKLEVEFDAAALDRLESGVRLGAERGDGPTASLFLQRLLWSPVTALCAV